MAVDKILNLKIDVTKIDKARLFKGEKGIYLNCTLLYKEEADEYKNNGMIIQDVTKEEREAGQKGNILGNAKEAKYTPKEPEPLSEEDYDDLPF